MENLVPGRKPCTHCGDCCRNEVCPIGEIFTHTTKPPCPALARDNKTGEYWCGLVVCPETAMSAKTEFAKYWARKIGEYLKANVFNFGAGCEYKEGEKTDDLDNSVVMSQPAR